METIVNKTSFYVDVELVDADGVAIDPTSIDFKIEHFTNTLIHEATKVADEYTNCEVIDGAVRCYLSAFDFGFTGQLKQRVTIYYTNSVFEDNTEQVISIINLLDAVIV